MFSSLSSALTEAETICEGIDRAGPGTDQSAIVVVAPEGQSRPQPATPPALDYTVNTGQIRITSLQQVAFLIGAW
jgi:hypothetical protein